MVNEQIQRKSYEVITDIWQALKPRLNVRADEQYWEDVVQTFAGIGEQYKDTPAAPVASRMAVAAASALEDIYRERTRQYARN